MRTLSGSAEATRPSPRIAVPTSATRQIVSIFRHPGMVYLSHITVEDGN